ncbi:hypothetical protein DRJ23_02085 [Candidatus Acetothermia bacterium]|nr:MAG: hypothetical protein DRJ23_02085 [Candidatus Acetothermia bacterium]
MHEAIDRAVGDAVETLPEILAGAGTGGIRYALRRMAAVGDPAELLTKAADWAVHPAPEMRQLACGLAVQGYKAGRKQAVEILHRLSADEERSVRDTAGRECGRLLCRDFSRMLEEMYGFRTDPSPWVRRAVALAAMTAGKERRLERAEPLLKLLEPLLADRAPEVRRSLGPVAIGGGLLRYYPEMTFEYLVKWSTANDEQVLWNVAMSFSGPGAVPLVKKALIVLRRLSLDERRYVWRAVASAMWKLGRKRPEIVRPELARWLEDERRVRVARAALKYL